MEWFSKIKTPTKIPLGFGKLVFGKGCYIVPISNPNRLRYVGAGGDHDGINRAMEFRGKLVFFTKTLIGHFTTLYDDGKISYVVLLKHVRDAFPYVSKSLMDEAITEMAESSCMLVEEVVATGGLRHMNIMGYDKGVLADKDFTLIWTDKERYKRYAADYQFFLEISFGRVNPSCTLSKELREIFQVDDVHGLRAVRSYKFIMELFWSAKYLKDGEAGDFNSFVHEYLEVLCESYLGLIQAWNGLDEERNHNQAKNILQFVGELPLEYAGPLAQGWRIQLNDMEKKVYSVVLLVEGIISALEGCTEHLMQVGLEENADLMSEVIFYLEEYENVQINYVDRQSGELLLVRENIEPITEKALAEKLAIWLTALRNGVITEEVTLCQHTEIKISKEVANQIIQLSDGLLGNFGLKKGESSWTNSPHLTGTYGLPDIRFTTNIHTNHKY
jgi:hypothetical protein